MSIGFGRASVADRIPASDLDAEAAVLSACLHDRTAVDAVRREAAPDDFYAHANRTIFEAICHLADIGQPCDVVTTARRLKEVGRWEAVGGATYLAQISDATPAVAHVGAHAKIIRRKASQRRVVEVCTRVAAEGYGEVEDVSKWAQDASQALADAAPTRHRGTSETLAELVPVALDELRERKAGRGKKLGVDTGWSALTKKLNGWRRGKMIVVAGRPGMGKSSLLLGALLNVARQGQTAVMISCEMEKHELVDRALAIEANVDVQRLESGSLNDKEWENVVKAGERLRKLPLVLTYQPAATIADIRAELRTRANVGQLGLVAIDYLQILNGERGKGESREGEVSELSRRICWMAQEFDVPVLTASQLNRDVEKRQDRRPTLADLRESGAIEQDAHTVVFLYRDEYYRKEEPTDPVGELELIVAKQRGGPTGTVTLGFVRHSTAVVPLVDEGEQALRDYDDIADNYGDDPYDARYP
jgi:replicative DNA helicase